MTPTLPQSLPKSTTESGGVCEHVAKVADQGSEAISRRLDELKREWSAERCVMAASGGLLLAGLALAVTTTLWWLALVAVAGVALAQYLFTRHSWLEWPFAAFGVRSERVIEEERIAFRVLRGDFKSLPTIGQLQDRDAISRMAAEGGPAYEEDDTKFSPREAAGIITAASADDRE